MWDWQAISNSGERVSHLYPNDLYFAHLALYHFALPFARDGDVLDAGCGAGYGAAFLARGGAGFVDAVDTDPEAIAFCRHHFELGNLRFRQMDVQRLPAFAGGSKDLVFSSNTLEHVPDVGAFLREAHRLLRPTGTLVVAVPPITSERQLVHEMSNQFHLNIWSPRQWLFVLGHFFAVAEVHGQQLALEGVPPRFDNRPEDTVITEADFIFPPLDAGAEDASTLTVLLVARQPLGAEALPPAGARIRFVDHSFTRSAPRVPPLRPDALDVPPRPIAELPRRAWWLVRQGGPFDLPREALRYVRWRAQRIQSRRARRKWRPPES
jgi:SAM-dependent methyltransferase